jgi:hypothetical protein
MITAKHINPRLDEMARTSAALVFRFPFATLRQVESHVR